MHKATRLLAALLMSTAADSSWAASPKTPQPSSPAVRVRRGDVAVMPPHVVAERTIGAKSPASQPQLTIIQAQVLLARVRFSPGVIDGLDGQNFRNAVSAFALARGLPTNTGQLTPEVWAALTQGTGPALRTYVLTEDDVAGPWSTDVGEDFVKLSQAPMAGYTHVEEMLGERFHMGEGLLRALNPGADFSRSGAPIVVADVAAAPIPSRVKSIEIDEGAESVRAFDAGGQLLAYYPATVGSSERPSPVGVFAVKGVARHPVYVYDPTKLTWGPKEAGKLTIPPGPNNPVGAVWIALTAPSYGIHGTPEPSRIGKTASHGCVRLTNWDAQELAEAVRPGTVVTFTPRRDAPKIEAAVASGEPSSALASPDLSEDPQTHSPKTGASSLKARGERIVRPAP